MTGIGGTIGLLFDLLLVIIGFGLIIFVHELGHFLAAKWAGIRVLAFAIGFGPAMLSFRKGLGVRVGSSEPEYIKRLQAEAGGDSASGVASISPTEYRLNYLPLGGYVKMLGQEDLNPNATSAAPDSYQRCKPWKRMVVISAGVVMNVFAAAVLFIIVFMSGLKTEPATVGSVQPNSPAAAALPQNAAIDPGLRSGDRLIEINGRRPNSFNDLVLQAAMTRRNGSMFVSVERDGVDGPLVFEVRPEVSERTRLLDIGVEPPRSTAIHDPTRPAEREQMAQVLAQLELPGLEPGMRLARVGEQRDVRSAADLIIAVRESGGEPFEAEFVAEDGRSAVVTVEPRPAMQHDQVKMPSSAYASLQHLLGLTPVMRVAGADERSQGLQTGDIFARVGAVEFPSIAEGIAEIHRHYGQTIEVAILRETEDGGMVRVELSPDVRRTGNGQIGFSPGETTDVSTLLALPPRLYDTRTGQAKEPTAAAAIIRRPGMRVAQVDQIPVSNFAELRAALREVTRPAYAANTAATVQLTLELPIQDPALGARPVQTVEWRLAADDLHTLHDLGWTSPIWAGIFDLEEFTLRADGPIEAVQMGIAETHRVMMMTYVTFARLFQGTVKVEHLKGPVGIAHMGTRIAERGFIWLLFFMALISVNLAVINFLPLPIVDGGQFIFLVIEQVRGKPVPVEVQNVATLAGLLLIGAVFIIVTFHDIANLFS